VVVTNEAKEVGGECIFKLEIPFNGANPNTNPRPRRAWPPLWQLIKEQNILILLMGSKIGGT
jgi:hypothetical protein